VLLTHPFSNERGAALERTVEVPAGQETTLTFGVAAQLQGAWQFRVFANDGLLTTQVIDDERWRRIKVDLTRFAGEKVALRLENCVSGGGVASGYWSDLKVQDANSPVAVK
jgi:hypothetical protein